MIEYFLILCGIVTAILVLRIGVFAKNAEYAHNIDLSNEVRLPGASARIFWLIFVLSPPIEEALLCAWLRPEAGIIVAGVIFGVFHGLGRPTPIAEGTAFLVTILGVICGLAWDAAGRSTAGYLYAIGLHYAWNVSLCFGTQYGLAAVSHWRKLPPKPDICWGCAEEPDAEFGMIDPDVEHPGTVAESPR